MEYTVNQLAKLSGVSARTLRYYDQIGLLCPRRMTTNGYRIYGLNEVDRLQQILFYKALGVALDAIYDLLEAPDFNKEQALTLHLSALLQKKNQIEVLIDNVTKTISTLKGEMTMSDPEKFAGFKEELIQKNEQSYGKEIRKKYGDETINASNVKVKGMSQETWNQGERLNEQLSEVLKEAYEKGDPASSKAQEACSLHKEWLTLFWPDGMYTKEAHLGLAQMYCEDERFKRYYEKIAEGVTEFFLEAMEIYCKA